MFTNLHLHNCKHLISQCSLTPFSMLVIIIVHMSTGVIEPAVPMESALLLGQALMALSLSMTQSFNPKDVAIFHSGHWHQPWSNICRCWSSQPCTWQTKLKRSSLGPRSQHQLLLIVPPILALPVPSKPVKQWNFCKANWSHCNTLTNKLVKSLLPPDSPNVDPAYQDFCNVIRTAAKHSIPRSHQITTYHVGIYIYIRSEVCSFLEPVLKKLESHPWLGCWVQEPLPDISAVARRKRL